MQSWENAVPDGARGPLHPSIIVFSLSSVLSPYAVYPSVLLLALCLTRSIYCTYFFSVTTYSPAEVTQMAVVRGTMKK